LGLPLGPADALILESLTQMVRTVGFVMPGGLGLQEGVLVLIGPQLGIDADSALALALVRRTRELALGAPALLAGWWLHESAGRRLPLNRDGSNAAPGSSDLSGSVPKKIRRM